MFIASIHLDWQMPSALEARRRDGVTTDGQTIQQGLLGQGYESISRVLGKDTAIIRLICETDSARNCYRILDHPSPCKFRPIR